LVRAVDVMASRLKKNQEHGMKANTGGRKHEGARDIVLRLWEEKEEPICLYIGAIPFLFHAEK